MVMKDEITIDRKSTRLNSSHGYISYAVFCLKKKNKQEHAKNVPTATVISMGKALTGCTGCKRRVEGSASMK